MKPKLGDSEKSVERVFRLAKKSHPCVVLIENIEILCPREAAIGIPLSLEDYNIAKELDMRRLALEHPTSVPMAVPITVSKSTDLDDNYVFATSDSSIPQPDDVPKSDVPKSDVPKSDVSQLGVAPDALHRESINTKQPTIMETPSAGTIRVSGEVLRGLDDLRFLMNPSAGWNAEVDQQNLIDRGRRTRESQVLVIMTTDRLEKLDPRLLQVGPILKTFIQLSRSDALINRELLLARVRVG